MSKPNFNLAVWLSKKLFGTNNDKIIERKALSKENIELLVKKYSEFDLSDPQKAIEVKNMASVLQYTNRKERSIQYKVRIFMMNKIMEYKNWALAKFILEAMLEYKDNDFFVWELYGLTLKHLDQFEEADQSFRHALKLNKNSHIAQIEMGRRQPII